MLQISLHQGSYARRICTISKFVFKKIKINKEEPTRQRVGSSQNFGMKHYSIQVSSMMTGLASGM